MEGTALGFLTKEKEGKKEVTEESERRGDQILHSPLISAAQLLNFSSDLKKISFTEKEFSVPEFVKVMITIVHRNYVVVYSGYLT